MDVFDLFARIVLDDSDLNNLGGLASKAGDALKNGLATAAKVGAAAIGAATAAATAFAAESVKVGAEFDSSMSQVAATMGTTVDQIQNLRDFALEMGSTTSFSASQAAEALNYMALAGYSADDAMTALPNVLNLAAAGGMELAAASDMVTDAQSALGLTMEESAEMVDMMAVASSKTNTSVAQLGEAILTVGGTAKNLSGGTNELATTLGLLADNGIKGAEGGTHLRNIILSLSAPTDTAAKAMKSLGLEVFDAEGNMRPLNETFEDLNAVLSTMTQGDQTQVLSEIFNKTDLSAVNALLATDAERWEEVSAAIGDASGAAQQMADTQLDNLEGDIVKFQSALEGAQIALSDQLTPSLREFAQFGTDAVSELSEAFKDGGLEGAMEALGTILSEGLDMVIGALPDMIDAGMQLLGALGEGLMGNIDTVVDAAVEIVVMLADTMIENLPEIISAAVEIVSTLVSSIAAHLPEILSSGEELLNQFVSGIETGLPNMVSRLPQIINNFLTFISNNFPAILSKGVELLNSLVNGIIGAIPEMVSALPQIITSFTQFIAQNLPLIVEAGYNILTNLIVGIIKTIPDLVAAIPTIITAIVDSFSAKQSMLIEVGKNIINGIKNGVIQAGTALITSVKSVVNDALNSVKSFLGIHSPSTKFRDEVGKYIGMGVAVGIEDSTDDAVKAADKMAKNLYSTSKEWADRQTKYMDLSYDEQIELWETIQSQFIKGSKQYADAEEKIFDLRKKQADEMQKALEAESKAAEKAAKEEVQAAKDRYSELKKWADRQTKMLELSYDEQIDMWQNILYEFDEGSDQFLDAEEKIFDLRKAKAKEEASELEKILKLEAEMEERLRKEREKALENEAKARENFVSKLESTYAEMESIESNYQNTLAKRTQEIVKSYSLFAEVPEKEKVAGTQLISNLQDQISNIEAFYSSIDELANRGVGEGLVAEIRAMGVGASDELEALLALSDDELSEYADLYQKKQELANSIALDELAELREETDLQLQEHLESIEALYDEYAPQVGTAFTDGLAEGIQNGMSNVVDTALEVAQATVTAVKDVLGIHSPSRVFAEIGENMALGVSDGWENEFESVRRNITGNMNFETANVDFASSGLGVSSAGIINSVTGTAAGGTPVTATINLMFPNGQTIATYLLPDLFNVSRANGTPIYSPT